MKIILATISCILIISCHSQVAVVDTTSLTPKPKLIEVGLFPTEINECSALVNIDGRIIAMNDGSVHTQLQAIDTADASIIETINISQIENIDWEAMQYHNGNLYIADVGNNEGDRMRLQIYTVPYNISDTLTCIDTIDFIWPDQTDFSTKLFHDYDCEAMLIDDDQITFFSKNRNDYKSNIYRYNIPTKEIIKGENIDIQGLVTDATRHPDGDIILLSYRFSPEGFDAQVNIIEKINGVYSVKENIDLNLKAQIEGIVHLHDHQYLIASESESEIIGGKLFILDLMEYYK